ncbi:MAG TPA: hypothetical protein VNQ80_04510 [Parapedobacter sp.]|uniref:hypothetical protein n=1 Tax=Parapedobacter sp. TaxID=1958893 RepID=UPI002C8F686B|nr:hypothetical protein [Parapedobacter sp.]HWK56574.1 hypothetical protein [Parapedobacter sp.]
MHISWRGEEAFSGTARHLSPVLKPVGGRGKNEFMSGVLRRSLIRSFHALANLRRYDTRVTIGSHDPDGHLFTIRSFYAHKTARHGNNSDEKEDSPPTIGIF